MKKLTNAEEKIMIVLWKLNGATVSHVMAECNPKPGRTTISTVIRILEKRGYVRHKSYGQRFYVYSPVVTRDEYSRLLLFDLLKSFFNDSFLEMLLFYSKEKNLNSKEIDQLISTIKKASPK